MGYSDLVKGSFKDSTLRNSFIVVCVAGFKSLRYESLLCLNEALCYRSSIQDTLSKINVKTVFVIFLSNMMTIN